MARKVAKKVEKQVEQVETPVEQPQEEMPGLKMPDDVRFRLLYQQSVYESALKDIKISDSAILEYMGEHVRKLAVLKERKRAAEAAAEKAKADYVAFYATVERNLGVELKRCSVLDDGRIIVVDEPTEEKPMVPAREQAPVSVPPPVTTSSQADEPFDDGKIPK